MNVGPDAARYLIAAQGRPVARPFHLRWLLPALCGTHLRRWWAVWWMSWPVLGVGMVWWAHGRGLDFPHALTAAALVLALPGVWGPSVVRPVGVDLPALAFGVLAVAMLEAGGNWIAGAVFLIVAASYVKESSPIWMALWAWSPVPLVGLVAPLTAALIRKPGMDAVTAQEPMRTVHDHPIRTALDAHRGRWRDAWLMVAPWGICLLALRSPSLPLVVCLVAAYAQLLVATDSVRLFQCAAGPPMALAAAALIPTPWLLPAVVAHTFWWRRPETI